MHQAQTWIKLFLSCLLVIAIAGCGSSGREVAAGATTTQEQSSPGVTQTVSESPTPGTATPTFVPTPEPASDQATMPPTPTAELPTEPPQPPSPTLEPPSPTVAPPTSTAEPPTATVELPTATVSPPTAVPTPPTATPSPAPIVAEAKPTPTAPAPTGEQRGGGKIFYLAADGATINTIRPDGSDIQLVIKVDKTPEEQILELAGEPSGTFLLYSLRGPQEQWPRTFLVRRGRASPLPSLVGRPRWSPEGTRFVAQMQPAAEQGGSIFLYDTSTGAGQELPVRGTPDWFPDGQRLVYVDHDIFVYDLRSGSSIRLTQLPSEGEETWYIQEAHVLPDGEHILFWGGQRKNVGASGNGQQWWLVPAAGGELRPWSEPGGNGISGFAYSPQRDLLGYAESAHSSACVSLQSVVIAGADAAGGLRVAAPIPPTIEQSENAAFYVAGLSFAPDNEHIAYSLVPYRCQPGAEGPQLGVPAIYSWNFRRGTNTSPAEPFKLVDGLFPVWIR